ncbi:MAG: hypothetical protein WC441_00545 [Patescibacteria group bacterium]
MPSKAKELRAELKHLSSSFYEEENVFRRSLIVFNFVETIFKNKEAKKSFDFLVAEASEEMKLAETGNEEAILKTKLGCGCRFWRYFADLDGIHSIMKKMRRDKDRRALKKLDDIICRPYSVNLFRAAFQVVSDCVLEKMEQEEFFKNSNRGEKTWFDSQRSILYIKGYKVPIAKQDKETNAHKILKYIFKDNKDNLKDTFFYSEMAEDVFEDLEYKEEANSWRKYYDCCVELNNKIFNGTKKSVENFLIFNSGKKGYLKINPICL